MYPKLFIAFNYCSMPSDGKAGKKHSKRLWPEEIELKKLAQWTLFIAQYPDWIDLFRPIMRYFIIYFVRFHVYRTFASLIPTLAKHFINKWLVTLNFVFDKKFQDDHCLCNINCCGYQRRNDLYEEEEKKKRTFIRCVCSRKCRHNKRNNWNRVQQDTDFLMLWCWYDVHLCSLATCSSCFNFFPSAVWESVCTLSAQEVPP